LDLNKNEDELLTEMRKTTRYLIRQSQKIGVIIKKSTDKKHLKDFLKLYNLTSKRHGFVRHQGIEEEFEIFNKDNQIQLFKAFYHEKLLSASLFVYYQNQAIYHHSASIDQKIPASYLLQWEAIKEAKKRGLKIYNFWGVTKDENNKKHPWYGLSLFKRGFGGRQVEYLHTHDLPRSILYCATYITESYRKFVKGY
jgi:lipid II:glycine glycyltransferase (peptidoglycan interpeptide bridge formation enzyme)